MPSSPSSAFCSGSDIKAQLENTTENCSTLRRAMSLSWNTSLVSRIDKIKIASAIPAAKKTCPSKSNENSR